MKIVATMLVRSDAWSINLAVQSALLWADEIVFLEHRPDGPDLNLSRAMELLDGAYPGRINGLPAWTAADWDEMVMRQRLLGAARERGATHVGIVDADEAVTAPVATLVRRHAERLAPGELLAYPMAATHYSGGIPGALDLMRVDGPWRTNPGITLLFRDAPGLSWRNAEDGYCYHARNPKGSKTDSVHTPLSDSYGRAHGGIFHLQYASLTRLLAKAAYYKAMETIKFPGRMTPAQLNEKYDWTLRDGESGIYEPIPAAWWDYPFGDGRTLVDLVELPWQASALKALVARHGFDAFKGVELHGVLDIPTF